MDTTTILLIIVGVTVFCIFVWLSCWLEQERRKAIQIWAESHGWSYNPSHSTEIYYRYSFLNTLREGSNRYAFDLLTGQWKGYSAEAFNFHYQTQTRDSKGRVQIHHHYLGVVLLHLERSFPDLVIYPKGFFGNIINFLGLGGIKFESVEFFNKFTVHCQDKKFAYDFCHTIMMTYLLNNPQTSLQLKQDVMVVYQAGMMEPQHIEYHLIKLCEMRRLMPEYLFRN